MANTRQQRSGTRTDAPKRQAGSRAVPVIPAGRASRNTALAVAGLVALGLALWIVLPSVMGGDGASAEPIATLDAPDFHALLVNPQDPEHLYFGSHSGTQESHDGGVTWEDGGLHNADAMQLSTSPEAPETIYATGHDVFQVSHDGGRTWQPLDHDLPGTDIHGFAQDQDDPQRLVAFVVGAGVFTSADGGTMWEPLPAQPPGGGMHVALAAVGGALYAATDAGLHVSRDGGQSWDAVGSQPTGQVVSMAIPASAPQTLYVGTPSGLSISTDGGASWRDVGPDGVVTLAVAATPSEPQRVFLLSDDGGIYRSDDGGETWR